MGGLRHGATVARITARSDEGKVVHVQFGWLLGAVSQELAAVSAKTLMSFFRLEQNWRWDDTYWPGKPRRRYRRG